MALQKVDTFTEVGEAYWQKGFGPFKKVKDPTNSMVQVIESSLIEERREITAIIGKHFNLEDESFTKYEFIWMPSRAQYLGESDDEPFEMKCKVSILLTKERSLIIAGRTYRYTLAKGCGPKGKIRLYKSNNYEMEEIYYNKITSVSSHHNEETYKVISDGCNSKEQLIVMSVDGFKIRAGEVFEILANDKYAGELAEARSFINKKVSDVN